MNLEWGQWAKTRASGPGLMHPAPTTTRPAHSYRLGVVPNRLDQLLIVLHRKRIEAKKPERAMSVLNDGLKKCKDSPGLKAMLNAVRNKNQPKLKAFAPTW